MSAPCPQDSFVLNPSLSFALFSFRKAFSRRGEIRPFFAGLNCSPSHPAPLGVLVHSHGQNILDGLPGIWQELALTEEHWLLLG